MATGFTFGAKTTAAPTFGTGSITFGTPAVQPQQQFGFGTLTSSAPSLFGSPAPAINTMGFKPTALGAPAAAPTGATAGFGLGAAPAFGAPTSAPSTGFSFGAPAAPVAANPGLSFGAPVSSAPAAGLSFGASFGQPVATSAAAGLSFGAPATTAATGFSFGAPAASTGLSFGAPATASTGLTFGTATTVPAFGGLGATAAPAFGTVTAAAPTLGLSFGAQSTAAAVAPSLFGTTTTTSAGTGLSFGAPTSTNLSFGLGGLSTATPSIGLGASLATTTTAAPPITGLGGIASTQSKSGTSSAAQKEVAPKDNLLPNEFLQLVEQFKNVVQEEKRRSSDVSRCSVKDFRNVENELDILVHQLNHVENELQINRHLSEKLKYDTAQGLQHIEMAQRTQDTPPSLQYENTAPLQFFLELTDTFEKEIQILKVKIDNTAKFIKKRGEWTVLTSQDLTAGLKRLHETFVALAGRMQSIHNQIESQKEIFLNIRKQTIRDNVNPFEQTDKSKDLLTNVVSTALKQAPLLASGPTPFNSFGLTPNNLLPTQTAAFPTTATGLSFGTNTLPLDSTLGASTSLFKPTTTTIGTSFGATQPFQLNASNSFQLQKPPTGNKRGKQ